MIWSLKCVSSVKQFVLSLNYVKIFSTVFQTNMSRKKSDHLYFLDKKYIRGQKNIELGEKSEI